MKIFTHSTHRAVNIQLGLYFVSARRDELFMTMVIIQVYSQILLVLPLYSNINWEFVQLNLNLTLKQKEIMGN